MFKRKNKREALVAQVVSVDPDKVVFSVEAVDTQYQVGQNVIATVSATKKTALGRKVKVSDVIAQGMITKVEGKKVTIKSKLSDPIISKKALRKVREDKSVVNIKEITKVIR